MDHGVPFLETSEICFQVLNVDGVTGGFNFQVKKKCQSLRDKYA